MLGVLAAATLAGAGIGAAAGALAGGIGAIPGAVGGAALGAEIGVAALTWLGVGFLVASFGGHTGELAFLLKSGVELAWDAGGQRSPHRECDIEAGARHFADAVAVVMLMVLEGIVAYLLKRPALAATHGALRTATNLRTAGSQTVADETVAGLVSRLRASKLGDGFATWVEKNWRDLVDNPKLNPPAALEARGVAKPLGEAETPSALKKAARQGMETTGSPKVGGGNVANTISREGIVGSVGKAVQPHLKTISQLDADALVGFRGSLARGFKGEHKGGAPFTVNDFDVDAFIVSDKLAAQYPKSIPFRNGGRIGEIGEAQKSIDQSLRQLPEFSGLRNEPFTFRIYTQREIQRMQANQDAQYFFIKN